jgi:hypothetical protein
MTYGVVRAFQVIVNTLESTEKAALYHARESRTSVEGKER